jgi:hypothetical protein
MGPELAAFYGLSVNTNHGSYRSGVAYGIEKKIKVEMAYRKGLQSNGDDQPNFQRATN